MEAKMPSFVYWMSVIFATYGISHILVWEDGPYDILSKLRYFAGVRYTESGARYGEGGLSGLLNCQICTSVWVAFPVALVCMIPLVAVALSAIGAICMLSDFSE